MVLVYLNNLKINLITINNQEQEQKEYKYIVK